MKFGILCSGELGFTCLTKLIADFKVELVFTDAKSKSIIAFCEDKNVPNFIGNPRGGNATEFLINKQIDVLISINYLFIIDSEIIKSAKKIAFNIHGSLLPKYRGRTPHVWAIINNEIMTGITAHVIDSGCDTGDIISQIEIPILEEDTGASILNKYQQYYLPIIYDVIEKIKMNELRPIIQNHKQATFFEKRTPEDGQINWDWQKERIRNWVRALSNPYPGAFSFYSNQKIIIDKVSYSDVGFHQNLPNGTILLSSPNVIVKTSNGAIQLDKIRGINFNFEKGKKFEDENR